MVGDKLFTAVIGGCGMMLGLSPAQSSSNTAGASSSSASTATATPRKFEVHAIDDILRDQAMGPRSLGDRAFKAAFAPLQFARATCSSWTLACGNDGDRSVLLLGSGPMLERLSSDSLSELAVELEQRPRAISSELSVKVFEAAASDKKADETGGKASQQFTAVTVAFFPPREVPHDLQSLLSYT